ncbi:MAG: ABC transporter permease [Verrucomicrobia subdivision 3 bacterium]|nr:ABC transporter permease [Limisphaerales bacterium]
MNDLKFAFRQLLKNPGFTAVAVLTLALGIGATTTVFNLIQGVLLTPPPYPEPGGIVIITQAKMDGQSYRVGSTAAQWVAWRKEAKSFEAMAGYIWTFDFLVRPEGSEFFQGMEVTPEYFNVIKTQPLLGRTFVESDASAKGDTVIILGYDFWQRRFNGDTNILGKTLKITRAEPPLEVVGVMPPGVRFLPAFSNADFPNYDINARVDYWIPVTPERSKGPEWNVAGRLHDGISLAQAQAELSAIAAKQAQLDRRFEGITAKGRLLVAELNRDGARLLLPMLGAVVLVFLIACGNVAGLLLARGLQRQREYAVRCALGAHRVRLFRHALVESLILALGGGAVGGTLAIGAVRVLKAIGGTAIPRLDAVSISWPVLVCCFAAAVVAAGLAGLMPALRASRLDLAQAMKGGGPTSSASRSEHRLLGGIAVVQTAFTLALLVGATLLIRSVDNLARLRPGFETQNLLTMSVTVPNWDGSQWIDFHVRSLERLASLPGVRHAAFGWGLPLTGDKWTDLVTLEGQPETQRWTEKLIVPKRSVTPNYFDALGMQIEAGRTFRPSDNLQNWKSWPEPAAGETPFVCIINAAFAEQHFPNSNPLGRKVHTGPWRKRSCEIVGVVASTRTESLTQSAEPEIYIPFLQCPVFTKHLVIQTASNPHLLIEAVRRELRTVDPTIAIERVKTFEQIRGESVAAQVFAMRLMIGFSILGTVLALVGIYGVLSLTVGSRKREIAIRMAVGAQRHSVLALILRRGLGLVTTGLVCGMGAALLLARVLQSLLFGVEPGDPFTFAVAAILLLLVAAGACLIPARRAVNVNPMEALRYE